MADLQKLREAILIGDLKIGADCYGENASVAVTLARSFVTPAPAA